MKNYYINQLITGDEIQDFFLIKEISVKTGSNKKQYLDLRLGDSTGELFAKKWDISDEELEGLSRYRVGDIIKLKAQVTEWNNAHQLKISKIRFSGPEDNLDRNDYYKAAPENPNEMYEFILGRAKQIGDADFKAVAVRVLDDNKEKLLYYPAAARNHHAEYAGLLWHMKRMLMMAAKFCEVYTILEKDILACGVILHDIEKIREMNADENGVVTEYSFEGVLLGHLVQGAAAMRVIAAELGIPEEKAIMLEHMIISHHYEPEFGSPRRPMFPEAEILHYLDMVDSKMFDMEEALASAEPGGFSDRIRTLDNRQVYRRTW
ncbi:MAG: HD domain-containing protein [Clostridiales Family XIII bacterium]|jgi:3'-5' exoribonuclease|nr:HD domain-containing protein [Clostridiales Family XIII bacterium]